MSCYAISLGSNLGDRLDNLRQAAADLSRLGRVEAVSGLYETAPIGGPEQSPFLNSVVLVETVADPETFLASVHSIEERLGRNRDVRWGPRTLDLDIVAWDGPAISTPDLSIPHPLAGERRFVLEPLASVWPEAPVAHGLTAVQAVHAVQEQEVDLLAGRWAEPSARRPGRYWVSAQLVWFIAIAVAMASDGSLPEGEVGFSRLFGGLLLVIGGLLAYRAMRHLGTSLTALPEPISGGSLVERGPYALARHPIYGGVVIFLAGISLVLDSFLAVILSAGLAGFFWLKSGYEEKQLRIAYPDYRAYQRRVTRRLIPFLI